MGSGSSIVKTADEENELDSDFLHILDDVELKFYSIEEKEA